MMWIRK